MKIVIKLRTLAGDFAENKEVAKKLRIEKIMPVLSKNGGVVLDFAGVSGATQSFIHALISDPLREFGEVALDNLYYKHANEKIQKIISIVYRYMQESSHGEQGEPS
ncbi:MAG: STAS-like domain-containing protein [Verrucomicrobiales bacterium]|jgi:hypothetical protein|nr:STAS-like domain-containing protein [Verrucomicrobiales bacterium]